MISLSAWSRTTFRSPNARTEQFSMVSPELFNKLRSSMRFSKRSISASTELSTLISKTTWSSTDSVADLCMLPQADHTTWSTTHLESLELMMSPESLWLSDLMMSQQPSRTDWIVSTLRLSPFLTTTKSKVFSLPSTHRAASPTFGDKSRTSSPPESPKAID